MSDHFRAKPSDLLKVWSMSKSSEQRQVTVRIPADTFHKIQAMEMMFPHRSRNELIADLLATSADEFESSLPFESHQGKFLFEDQDGDSIYDSFITGPKRDFERFLEQVKKQSELEGAVNE